MTSIRWVALSTSMSSLASAVSLLMNHASAAARMTAWPCMSSSTESCCVDKAIESGTIRGAFLAKLRVKSGRKMDACGKTANLLCDRQFATGANRLPCSESLVLLRNTQPLRTDVCRKFRLPDASLRKGRAGQTTISFPRLRWTRIFRLPSPHHAAGSLASEEVPSHLVMQTREKHAVQHVFNASFGSWIRAVESKGSFFPTKADHWAPLLHHGVFFGHQHWNSPFTWRWDDGVYRCACHLVAGKTNDEP